MTKRILLAAVVIVGLASAASAQEAATIVLRSGERVSGQLIDHGGVGFTISVGGANRTIPTGEVAVVEFAGGSSALSNDMAARLNNGQHVVVLKNGQAIVGNFYDIGGTTPLRITMDTDSGRRDFTSSEVGRIYLAPVGGSAGTAGAQPGAPGSVVVVANQAWTPTGLIVRRGETLTLQTTGEVQLSGDGNDKAHSAGAYSQRRPGRRRADCRRNSRERSWPGSATASRSPSATRRRVDDAGGRPAVPRGQRRFAGRQRRAVQRVDSASEPPPVGGIPDSFATRAGPLGPALSFLYNERLHASLGLRDPRSMPDWKDTLNLPRTEFPMKANLPATEPAAIKRWEETDLYEQIRRTRAGRPAVHPARWPAVCQRQHSHRDGAQQDSQRLRRQVAVDGWLRRALRRRLRLPRPADRAAGRSRARSQEARDVGGRFLPRLPRLRGTVSSAG